MSTKQTWGRRINDWLDEPEGSQFEDGKWRFWLPAVEGFSILNALLTYLIFSELGNLQNYMGTVLLGTAALVGWIAIGCLHYSHAKQGKMARGVSILDSATLLFVVVHFCFLTYIYGHAWILKGADDKYATELHVYNDRARQVSLDNAKIAEALRDAAELETQRAKIEQDTAYQLRIAARNGARINTQRGGIQAAISTAPVQLEKPPNPPEETSAAFLTRWDALVRLLNCGELILAVVTLIYIRTHSARFNSRNGGGYIGGTPSGRRDDLGK